MRLLLFQRLPYVTTHGGANKSNRGLLEALVIKGHTCGALISDLIAFNNEKPDADIRALLEKQGITPRAEIPKTLTFSCNGVSVYALQNAETDDEQTRREDVSRCAVHFRPDAIIVSCEDPGQLLLKSALASRIPVVFLARTTLALPFGPDGAIQSAERTALIQRAHAVVCVSEYIRQYCKQWGNINGINLPISLQPPGPYPNYGKFDGGLVSIINPCVMKGITIFVELARMFTSHKFGAIPTWGTTSTDLKALRALPNVTLLEPSDNIDDILQHTQVLLVPSLWAEAKGRVILEAMARGIPVLASDVGGIPEAKLGVDYLLPVKKIQRYLTEKDERNIPLAEVPEQDLTPWVSALSKVLKDRSHYENLSLASRDAGLAEIARQSVEPFEELLLTAAHSVSA
jgi:glycosyltransferase involved in cell wall biosynthesis